MRFGRLTVTRLDHPYRLENGVHKHTRYWCVCDCGKEISVPAASLTRSQNATRSCGCLKIEACVARLTTHGQTRTYEYKLLRSIMDRCHNKNCPQYPRYGGRGIEVFADWRLDANAFCTYIRTVLGPKPSKKHSLDRIKNDRGYEPGNLKWSTNSEQTRNSRHARLITALGKTQHLEDWANELGVHKSTLHGRASRYGDEVAIAMSIKQTHTQPLEGESHEHKKSARVHL